MLEAVADRLGLRIAGAQSEACAELTDWLAPAAARLGLTRFGTPVAFAENLMVPALDLLPHVQSSCSSVAEVGPGNGGLGLTIALLRPKCRVSLLDRRQRVCDFLGLTAARFRLGNCRVQRIDLRDPQAASEEYDLVIARAVASAELLLAHLPKLLDANGRIALLRSDVEIEEPDGLERISYHPTAVPGLWLDIYIKRCGTPPGKARHRS